MKTILKIGLASLLVLNQSCTDLETEVFSDLAEDNFPKTEEQFIAALGGAYSSLTDVGSHGSYFSNQAVSSDEMMLPQRGADWFSDGSWLRVHRHESLPYDHMLNNGWNALYRGISDANRVIELFEGLVASGSISQTHVSAFIAELKVLRAYQYWWLIDQYGNIPIVTRYADAEANPPTMDRADVFAFIEAELNENVPDLARTKDGTTYGRFNYWTGKALQARLYLNAEVYSGKARWSDAIAAADEVINSGLYSLESNYFSNFNISNEISVENIMVVPYDRAHNCCFQLAWMTLHYESGKTFNLAAQPWNGYCVLGEFYNLYDEDDLRKGKWGDQKRRGNFLAGPQFESDGQTQINDSSVESTDPDGAGLVFTPQINEHFPHTLRQAGVRIGKYEYESGGTGTMSNDFVLFRYAEILLNKAEVLLRLGDQSGLALVNSIRLRAGLSPYAELTADNLLDERAREMFYEGMRRSDLIRHGRWGDSWEFKPASDKNKELMPIPQVAINTNPALRQNPGYN